LLKAAHDPAGALEHQQQARQELIGRYLEVVKRYLGGALRREQRREEAIDELVQEFGLRVMRGSFRNASSEQGRFRHFLRTALSNLVADYRRGQGSKVLPLAEVEVATEDCLVREEEYTTMWREQLVQRALVALAEYEQHSGQPLSSVLKLALIEPRPAVVEMARRLSDQMGRMVDEGWVRKRLYLARQKLCELLRREVRQSLEEPTEEAIDEELAEVGLLAYCR
jgi:RNA polymerase sigma-70 factor (ECF subfamily)